MDRRAAPRPLRPTAHARRRRGACCAGRARRSRSYGSTGVGIARRPRALDAVEASPHERTLDVLGVDFYDPMASRHFRLPGHRTAGGRSPAARTRPVGRPAGPRRADPVARRPARPGPGTAAVGGGERDVQPGAQRPLVRPPRRLGPAPVPAGQPGRRGRRRRRRGAGRRATGTGRWSTTTSGAPTSPASASTASTAHRGGRRPGSTPTPWAGTRPVPTGRSSRDCGPATARCSTRRSAPADRRAHRPARWARPARTPSASATTRRTRSPAGSSASMAPTPCPAG